MIVGVGLGMTFPCINPQVLLPPGYSVQQDGETWAIYEGETQLAGTYDTYAAAVQGAWLAFQGHARVVGHMVDVNGAYLVDVDGNYLAALA